MLLTDTVPVSGARVTADGYLVADARVARTGIQEYIGVEVGRPELSIVRVYRPESSVFDAETMHGYAYRPLTNNHPSELVTADNWKEHAIGQTGGEVVRDGEFVRVPMVLMDREAIKAYQDGKRELSMGYESEIVFTGGVTDSGEAYDAIQTKMRMNHLALVDRARGGAALRIGDDKPKEEHTMSDTKTRVVLVDGLSVETTDAGAQAISKLQASITDAEAKLSTATTAHATAIAAKDSELAKRDAEIDALKAKVLTDAQIDAKVKDRADLIATAKQIADADYTGKSADEIRKAAVVAALGDAAVADKGEAYIAARFDILAEDAGQDPVRKALKDGVKPPVNDNGYSAYVASMNGGAQ